jgi:hypothetical protein
MEKYLEPLEGCFGFSSGLMYVPRTPRGQRGASDRERGAEGHPPRQDHPKLTETQVTMARLPDSEFRQRIAGLKEIMARDGTDIFMIYGDEYRRENLRYVSNYWPIFERGLLVVGIDAEPILLASPECEHIAREMSVWKDVRLVREVGMSYVPEVVFSVFCTGERTNTVVGRDRVQFRRKPVWHARSGFE